MFSKTYGVFNENADYMRLLIIYWHQSPFREKHLI